MAIALIVAPPAVVRLIVDMTKQESDCLKAFVQNCPIQDPVAQQLFATIFNALPG
jgi:hypothetical protein